MDGERTLAVCLVQTANGRPWSDQRRADRLRARLRAAFSGELSPDELFHRRDGHLERPAPGVPTVLKIDQEPNRPHTVLEVQTRDRVGLLWRITQTLHEAGCRVHFAKIATEGVRAIDSFYIDRAAPPHGPLTEPEADALRRRLASALEDNHAD
jgi:[protein-PII] uridylyltransferase